MCKEYPLYYMNLDYRIDRNSEMLDWLDESGFPEKNIHRISATHVPGRGHLGCLLSHIHVVEEFLKTSEPYAIILEDDFVPKDLPTFWSTVQRVFDDKVPFDMIMLSFNVLESTPLEGVSYLHKVKSSLTSSGYILNREFAPTLLKNFQEAVELLVEEENATKQKTKHYCLDQHWQKLMPMSRWYCFYPLLGWQSDSFSDIEGKITNRSS
jgi:GR25 family glycosyltransferase involved in LPS biosynthesis